MTNSIKIAPPNSLFFISDREGGKTPEITRGPRLWWTSSCIAIGCLAFIDGETEVKLGLAAELDPGMPPAFDGTLETPTSTVVVSTVESEDILSTKVSSQNTRIRIWTNRPREPDEIVIGVE